MAVSAPPFWIPATGVAMTGEADYAADGPYSGSANRFYVICGVGTRNHNFVDDTAAPPISYGYDGQHVKAGDWIGLVSGSAYRIVAIAEQSYNTVVCTVEDVDQYELSVSPFNYGWAGDNLGIIFRLDESGNPMIDGLPSSMPPTFSANILARFAAQDILTGGGGGALTVLDEGTPLGAFTQMNFVGISVIAATDATETRRVNIFIPPPDYASHMTTDDGSNGMQAVGESITRVSARISAPTNEGTPFKTGGWAGTDQAATSATSVTFTTPDVTTGFGGDSTMTVIVYDADGATVLATFTTPSLAANGTYANTNGSISVMLTGYAADTDRFKAKAAATVNIGAILPTGGRCHVTVTHIPDSETDGTGPYTHTQPDVFFDAPPPAPTVAGLSVAETTSQTVTKHISGIKYYTTGSKFTVAVADIDGHNRNAQKIGGSLVISAGDFGLSTISASPFGTGSANFTGYTNAHDADNIAYSSANGITASNFRYAGPGADASAMVSDPFRASTAATSAGLSVMIDTYSDDSTALLETFNGETRRLRSDFSTAWDSTAALANGDALVYGGSLMVPSRAFTMSPQSGAHGGGAAGSLTDFNTVLPSQTVNYTSLTTQANYYRNWTETPRDRASFTMAFSGSFPTNALAALQIGDLQVFVYKLSGQGNIGVPPTNTKPVWLHGTLNYNVATFDDGNAQTNAAATCRESTSSGNTINGTFGGFSMRGGIATRIVINNDAIRLDSIQVTFY